MFCVLFFLGHVVFLMGTQKHTHTQTTLATLATSPLSFSVGVYHVKKLLATATIF